MRKLRFTAARSAALSAIIVAMTVSPLSGSGANSGKRIAKPTSVSFNWYANRAPVLQDQAQLNARAQRQAVALTWGKSKWVCSPAGFGQRSTCYSR